MEIRDEMQKGKAECLEDNSPASTWTSELCYGATCNIKKKYRSKSAIIQTKLKFQNYLDNWINVREQWYDQEKAQGDFSIWTKEAQCSIVCLYPKTRFFQVSPEKEINTALRNGRWVPVVRIQKQTSQLVEHAVTCRKRIERNYALGIWLHDQVPSRAQVVQQLLQI